MHYSPGAVDPDIGVEKFFSYVGSNFACKPTSHNRQFEVVNEPPCANVEPILLLSFHAQPYCNYRTTKRKEFALYPSPEGWGLTAFFR
jgi:hypothetical protein